jgi:mRNA-degrading endonuclease RelE of RelBE toxin-antitoxin system
LVESDARAQTRHKFALDPPPDCADYELRVGNFRVMYRVEETEAALRVIVAIIGRKERNKLFVEGEEFEL